MHTLTHTEVHDFTGCDRLTVHRSDTYDCRHKQVITLHVSTARTYAHTHTRLQDVRVLRTLLTASTTVRSVNRLGATSTDPLMLSDKLEIILLRLGELDIQVLSNSGHYIGCGNYEPKAMSIWASKHR